MEKDGGDRGLQDFSSLEMPVEVEEIVAPLPPRAWIDTTVFAWSRRFLLPQWVGEGFGGVVFLIAGLRRGGFRRCL